MTWSFPQSAIVETVGVLTATSSCTLLSVSVADTLGSWVELIASTVHEWNGFLLSGLIFNPMTDGHIKVSTGAGGSETDHIIIDKLAMHFNNNTHNYTTFLPLRVPKGSRISAALQAANASDTVKVAIQGFTGTYLGHTGFMRAVGYGVQTAGPSGGTTVTFGANDTMGSYTELTSSTAEDLVGVIITCGFDAVISTNSEVLIDLALGPATERVIIPNIRGLENTSRDCVGPGWSTFYPVAIPSGTRIAIRGQTAHSSTETCSMSVLGVEA